jgi:hypothetical protein
MTTRPSAMRVPSPAEAPKPALPTEPERPKTTPPDMRPGYAVPAPSPISVAKIAGAISAVMTEIGVVAKEGRNEFHRYNYAKMEDVLQRLTPLIAKNGLAIIQTELDRSMFDEDRAIAVRYAFTIVHSSGEVWPERPVQTGVSRCRDSKGGFDDKCLNKAHTAARKYFLLGLFQIPTGDEDDADRGDNDRGSPRRAPVPSPSGYVAPHALPTQGEQVHTWTPKFLALIAKAESEAELTEWEKSNGAALDLVYGKQPGLYESVLKAFDKRRAELRAASAPEKPAERPSANPSPDKGEGVASAPAPTAASSPAKDVIPDAESDPDGFLKWSDAQLASVIDPHSLEVMYNDHIEPLAGKLMPPDQEELLGLFRKHEARLAP